MATTKLRIRPDKKKREGELSIYVQVCIDGKTKLYPTGVKTFMHSWDDKGQKIKKSSGSNDHVKNNLILEKRHNEIKDIIFHLIVEKDEVSFSAISEKLNPNKKNSLYFSDRFSQFYETQKSQLKSGTLRHYRVFRNQFNEFNNHKDIKVSNIDFSIYSNFSNWLINEKGQKNTTVNKRLKILKTFLKFCSKSGIYESANLANFTLLKEHNPTKIALSEKELKLIWEHDFSENPRLDKAKDLFIFGCATGLRESDIQNLKPSNFKDDFIYQNILKTSRQSGIPLNAYSKTIAEKYNYKLPKLSQQRLNDYLKEIGQVVGIMEEEIVVEFQGGKRTEKLIPRYELLSSHVARRTFITLSILKGIPIPVIQSITGHRDLTSFQKYIQINNHAKEEAMQFWN
ncbi:MAG: site-specific integrase [Cytophagales bacterium]|nr:site-specific integrase [Cytophagales bacterium]